MNKDYFNYQALGIFKKFIEYSLKYNIENIDHLIIVRDQYSLSESVLCFQ